MKFNNWTELSFFAAVLLSCYLFAEQLVIAVMAVSKNAYNTSVFSIYVIGVMVVLGSGMLKYVHKSIENTAGIVVLTSKERAPRYGKSDFSRKTDFTRIGSSAQPIWTATALMVFLE